MDIFLTVYETFLTVFFVMAGSWAIVDDLLVVDEVRW